MFSFFRRHAKRTVLGLLGATLLIGGLSACGHRDSHERWGSQMSAEQYAQKRDKWVERATDKLELDAAQKQRLVALADVVYAQRKAMMGNTTDPRAEVRALVAGDKFDAARAQAMVSSRTDVLTKGSPEVITALAAFYDSLNPAQQQKVRDYMDGRGRWFGRS